MILVLYMLFLIHSASHVEFLIHSMQSRSVNPSRLKRSLPENLKIEPIERCGGSVLLPRVGAARSSQLSAVHVFSDPLHIPDSIQGRSVNPSRLKRSLQINLIEPIEH